MEKAVGVVSKVVYFNEDNNYGIIKLKLDYKNKTNDGLQNILFSNTISILCTFDRKPFEDEEYEFCGELEKSSYGYQIKAKTFKRLNEKSKEGIITYLSSTLFPGVGIKAATKVFDVLGDDALDMILKDRNVLDEIDIPSKQKDVIYENLMIHYSKQKDLVSLLNLGLSMATSIKIMNVLGDNALNTVLSNPYSLIDLVEGIAFFRTDEIARKVGIPVDAEIRLTALVMYVIKTSLYQTGNSFIHIDDLLEEITNFTYQEDNGISKERLKQLIDILVSNKKIIIENNNIFEYNIYYDEIEVAKSINLFLRSTTSDIDVSNVDEAINKAMENLEITYSDKQIEAIKKALIEPIVIITGGPGTGKSTVIKGIIESYSMLFKKSELIKEEIKLVAPTGRASKRLKEVTNHYNSSTIHKLLGYQGHGYYSVFDDGPIKAKMLIIDEFSMVDINLASILFKNILPSTKIVIVGDVDQLPAVGIGDVLRDLIESKEITTVRLNKIHRQASDSTIINLAHSINEGYLPNNIIEKQKDRNFISCDDDRVVEIIKQVVASATDNGMDLIKDIQVLVPMYKGIVGIDAINYKLQDSFNKTSKEVIINGKRLRENDKVIQLINRQEKQVMNGDIGYIRWMHFDNEKFTGLDVMFDFGSVHYDKDEVDDLNLAYAISIHKSQGSEFGLVIVPFSFKYYIMLKRKLIYTAITRAKKFLIMVGNIDALKRGIVPIEEKRKTKLQERIHEILNNPNKIYDDNSAFQELSNNDDSIKIEDFMDAELVDEQEMENITPYDFLDIDK